MNSWNNEQYPMPNMMGGYHMPPMMPNPPNMVPPLLPPMCMMSEMGVMPGGGGPLPPPPNGGHKLIGPVIPEDHAPELQNDDMDLQEDSDPGTQEPKQIGLKHTNSRERERSDNRRDYRERDRPRRRSRSRDRCYRSNRGDRYDRNDGRGDRDHNDRRNRPSKWDNNPKTSDADVPIPGMGPYPPNMMGNNMMGQQQIDMPGMPNMANMGNMHNMGNIANMGNLPSMGNMANMGNMPNMGNMTNMGNMMSNMLEPTMMMNQMQMMPNQPVFLTKGILLPPMPGISLPPRRERPPGCRTIFVGGLTNVDREEIINEIFQRFGMISRIKLHKQGVCHVRFEKHESVEMAFMLSGYRFKYHDQMDSDAMALFVDYALNQDDQGEYERSKRRREPTPPRVEPYNPGTLNSLVEKIKSDTEFADAAPTLAAWLERGECNKKNANTFYSLIQATNNQIRRLFNEKMSLDDEYQNMKSTLKDKFAHVILQFEQVAKILSAAKHQRVSDHFTKQQRRNIDMWLIMTKEVDGIKEEFNYNFDEDDAEKTSKKTIPLEKYEELKAENENLAFELEGYKNEAHLAKNEAERKFEKFKAHYIAQQALQNKQACPPLPPPPQMPSIDIPQQKKPPPPPPLPDDMKATLELTLPTTEAKLISILTAFLMVHPLGASIDYVVSYVRSICPDITQTTVQQALEKYTDVFRREIKGVGASIEHKWSFITFDLIKKEN